MIRPIVIAYTTDTEHPGCDKLKRSCIAWDWSLTFAKDSNWSGEGRRLKAVLECAKECGKLGYTHAIHVDAFDVLAVGPPSELERILQGYGSPPLLLSCEAGCWPNASLAPMYGERKRTCWFPHSQYVLDLRQPWPTGFGDLTDETPDQTHLHKLVLTNTPGIILDRGCFVIQALAHMNPWNEFFAVKELRVKNLETDSYPLFLHGNGRTDMAWIPQRWVTRS